MSKIEHLSIICGVLIIAAISVMSVEMAKSQDNPKEKAPAAKRDLKVTTFMRQKLEASGEILEGLTTENADLIINGSKRLVEMSSAEKWQVQNDVMYRQFSGEFQRSATSLLEAAEKGNFDAAALKWIDVTMKCVDCHKFVRGTRLADNTGKVITP